MEKKDSVNLIIIGDELLIGQRQDTNSYWITKKLFENGLKLKRIITIGDTAEDIGNAIKESEEEAGNAILTGGLGPTEDDLTRYAVADYFGMEMRFEEDIYEVIRDRFNKRGVKLTSLMKSQAEFPKGAEIIPNEVGSAPGIFVQRNGFYCFSIPGVPKEMEKMMTNYILPRFKASGRGVPPIFKVFRTAGAAESILADKIGTWNIHGCGIAYLPNYHGVDIRITVNPTFFSQADSIMSQAEDRLDDCIREYIYGYGSEELEAKIGSILAGHGWSLTIAESCTGGLLSKMITDVPGASKYFRRGFVTYSNSAKSDMLGVKEVTLEKYGAVSAETVAEMAEGAADWAKAEFAIALSGVAGPSGGTPQKPVGTTYIAVLHPKGLEVIKHNFSDDRTINRIRSARAALLMLFNILRRHY